MPSRDYRRFVMSPDVVTFTCPACQSEPCLMVGTSQWFCETEKCRVLSWNPTMPADDQLTLAKVIRLAKDLAT
jgi:hypothetical protein